MRLHAFVDLGLLHDLYSITMIFYLSVLQFFSSNLCTLGCSCWDQERTTCLCSHTSNRMAALSNLFLVVLNCALSNKIWQVNFLRPLD